MMHGQKNIKKHIFVGPSNLHVNVRRLDCFQGTVSKCALLKVKVKVT